MIVKIKDIKQLTSIAKHIRQSQSLDQETAGMIYGNFSMKSSGLNIQEITLFAIKNTCIRWLSIARFIPVIPQNARFRMVERFMIKEHLFIKGYSLKNRCNEEHDLLNHPRSAVKIAILNWAIFNALVGNTDAHIKNLSCMVTSNGLVLTPLYDLISTAIYEYEDRHLSAELSQKMGEAKFLSELTRDDILLFGEELGLNRTITQRQLDKMLENIEIKADRIIEHVEKLLFNRRNDMTAIEDRCLLKSQPVMLFLSLRHNDKIQIYILLRDIFILMILKNVCFRASLNEYFEVT